MSEMKLGDLVRCTFQPGVSRVENGYAMPMEHYIKGELGIIVEIYDGYENRQFRVLFLKFGYTHNISPNGMEVINETR